jgi:peptidoglycan/LPS O-acetylase OafA/YrhL
MIGRKLLRMPPSAMVPVRNRIPELDSVRGVAVLLVLFFHGFIFTPIHVSPSWQVTRWFLRATEEGWVGVNLFFVLSGFLITGILLNSRDEPHYYRTFYWRRVLRILPAHYLILIVLLLTVKLGLTARPLAWSYLGLCFIYLANVTVLFGVAPQYNVLWSLAVEEQFYLLWPSLVRWLSSRGLAIASVFLIVACPALRSFYFIRGYEAGGFTWLVADGLAWGALLAIVVRGPLGSPKWLGRFSVLACGIAIIYLIAGMPYRNYIARALLNVLCTGVIAGVLAVSKTRYAGLLRIGWLRFFGDISYGLYLIHMLAFDVVDHFGKRLLPGMYASDAFAALVVRFLAGSTLAISLAYWSRWHFEEYFLRLKEKPASNAPIRVKVPEEEARAVAS